MLSGDWQLSRLATKEMHVSEAVYQPGEGVGESVYIKVRMRVKGKHVGEGSQGKRTRATAAGTIAGHAKVVDL
jgi:hypothetical protein